MLLPCSVSVCMYETNFRGQNAIYLGIGIGIEKVNKLTNAFFYSFLFFFYM